MYFLTVFGIGCDTCAIRVLFHLLAWKSNRKNVCKNNGESCVRREHWNACVNPTCPELYMHRDGRTSVPGARLQPYYSRHPPASTFVIYPFMILKKCLVKSVSASSLQRMDLGLEPGYLQNRLLSLSTCPGAPVGWRGHVAGASSEGGEIGGFCHFWHPEMCENGALFLMM